MADPKQSPSWMKLSGIGIELVGAVAGLTLMGYWWDRHFHTGPWGLLIGIALGIIGGTYNLIRQSLLASKEAGDSSLKSSLKTNDGDKKR
jgi:F0F1-type ATP synthase assembly protein I